MSEALALGVPYGPGGVSPMKAERLARRQALENVRDRYPGSKGSMKARALLLDLERMEEFESDHGGAGGAIWFVCAQVANGQTLREFCVGESLQYGVVWAWMTDTDYPERLERYYLAQRGVADAYVAEVVPLVDSELSGAEGGGRGGGGGSSSPDVPHRRLQAEMRLKVAGKYDRRRFGEEKEVGAVSAPTINFIMGEGSSVTLAAPIQPAEQLAMEAGPENTAKQQTLIPRR